MTKNLFFKLLKKELRCLKTPEQEKNINYYEEMIANLMENGFSEEKAVEKIGAPQKIAPEILENTPPEGFRKKDWSFSREVDSGRNPCNYYYYLLCF